MLELLPYVGTITLCWNYYLMLELLPYVGTITLCWNSNFMWVLLLYVRVELMLDSILVVDL